MLPPLPKPKRYFGHSTSSPMFDADEMKAYALDAVKRYDDRLQQIFHHGSEKGLVPPGWIAYGDWIKKLDEAAAKSA